MRRFTLLSLLALLLATAASVFGQQDTGTLLGTVVDPAGAVVPAATVTVHNAATGATMAGTTDKSGVFQFPTILVGTYSVQIAAQGFKTYDMSGVLLQSAEIRNLGSLRMEVGGVTEQVRVTAATTPVQTSSTEINLSIEQSKLAEITNKGGDAFQYFDLLPGVVDTSLTVRDNPTYNELQGIVINGNSGITNVSHTLDGVHAVDAAMTTMFVNPNVDAISEITVLTTGYQAEFGRNTGGSINFVTKSGTSDFHGTGHWYHRNEDLNANTFFNNRSGIVRPIYRYMLAGYTIGGPVYIPKHFNTKKNRLFFFASQEFTQIKVPTTTSTVNEPTALERAGNFSDLKTSAGALIPVLDPLTETAFPGNIIPTSRINTTGQAMLNLFPMPNGYTNPAPGQQYTANSLFYGTPSHTHSDTIVKIDANITSKLSVFYRYGIDHEALGSVFNITPGIGQQVNLIPGQSHAAHATYIFTPTLIAETLVGIGWNNYEFYHVEGDSPYFRTSTLNPPTLFPLPAPATVPGGTLGVIQEYPPYLPEMTTGGGNTVGETNYTPWNTGFFDPYANFSHSRSVNEDVTKVQGKHRFKFGIYVDRVFKDEPAPGTGYPGVYNFGSTTSNPIDTGSGYSNMLLGVFQTYSQATNRIQPALHYWQIEWYAQDSWRVTSKLTLEYGLRFVHEGAPNDTSGTSSDFYPSLWTAANSPALYRNGCKVALSSTGTCATANQVAVNPLTGAQTFNALVNTAVPGVGSIIDGMHVGGLTGNDHYFSYAPVNLAPRLGIAWDPTGKGKWAVRAGAGLFYNRASLGISGSGTAPTVYTPIVYYSYMTDLPSLTSSEVFSPVSGTIYNPRQQVEVAHNLNFSVQHDIGFSTALTLSYVGSFDRHAAETISVNNIPYQAYANPANVFNNTEINANFLRTTYPGMGTESYSTSGLSSLNYNSAQLLLQHRVSRGLFFSVAYTFSKALGSTSPDAYHTGLPIVNEFGQTVTLPNDRQDFYGPTTSDHTHVLAVNYAYSFPKLEAGPKALKAVVNGWTLTGTPYVQSGAPVSPSCSSTAAFPTNDPTETGQTARCQEVADPRAFNQSFYSNFNTAAFALAPLGSFGNTGLGIYREPTIWNWDMSLSRSVRIRERVTLTARWEAFNVFNHPEFNAFGATYSFNAANVNTSTTTGQMTSTLSTRQQELQVRLVF
jgi:hypothetical protein